MDSFPKLGRITVISASTVWDSEPYSFTPWLAQNLDLLSDALEIGELELKGTEISTGDFKIDILAEDDEGHAVIIENQFGNTDHRHLGQVISYIASQPGPATVIWVAENFKNDHRAAVDWLNSSTTDSYDFFAVEVEALKIGESDPAPFFKIVAKPNSWAKAVANITRDTSTDNRSNGQSINLAYWTGFSSYLKDNDKSFAIRRENADHYHYFPIGRTGISLSCTISSEKKRIGVELYIHDDALKTAISSLISQRETIEQELGESLEWQELPGRKASRVALFHHDVDLTNTDGFFPLFDWMLNKLQRFRRVFSMRVKELQLSRTSDDAQDQPAPPAT